MNSVLNSNVFVALQNLELAEHFTALPQVADKGQSKDNCQLGVKGDRLVIVSTSDSSFVRFFQAIGRFFSRISIDETKVNTLITKSFTVFTEKDSKVAAFMERVLEMNEGSKAARFDGMKEFANKGWAAAQVEQEKTFYQRLFV